MSAGDKHWGSGQQEQGLAAFGFLQRPPGAWSFGVFEAEGRDSGFYKNPWGRERLPFCFGGWVALSPFRDLGSRLESVGRLLGS